MILTRINLRILVKFTSKNNSKNLTKVCKKPDKNLVKFLKKIHLKFIIEPLQDSLMKSYKTILTKIYTRRM